MGTRGKNPRPNRNGLSHIPNHVQEQPGEAGRYILDVLKTTILV